MLKRKPIMPKVDSVSTTNEHCITRGNTTGSLHCRSPKISSTVSKSQLHIFEPTDSQGYSMECIRCGRVICIDESDCWDRALEENCSNLK